MSEQQDAKDIFMQRVGLVLESVQHAGRHAGYDNIQDAIEQTAEDAVHQMLQLLDGSSADTGYYIIPKMDKVTVFPDHSLSGGLADLFSEQFIQINN